MRTSILQKRSRLSTAHRIQKSAEIVSCLKGYAPFQRAKQVASFFATPTEPQISPHQQAQLYQNKRVYTPLLRPWGDRKMYFNRYKKNKDALIKNRFYILESDSGILGHSFTWQFLLIPLVAFDAKGNRCGMGFGYYDRLLKPIRISKKMA